MTETTDEFGRVIKDEKERAYWRDLRCSARQLTTQELAEAMAEVAWDEHKGKNFHGALMDGIKRFSMHLVHLNNDNV